MFQMSARSATSRNLGQGVGLLPDAADVVVGDVHGGGLDTEAHTLIAHTNQHVNHQHG
jgi:hypothetical protein